MLLKGTVARDFLPKKEILKEEKKIAGKVFISISAPYSCQDVSVPTIFLKGTVARDFLPPQKF